jgi:hypothetical protein
MVEKNCLELSKYNCLEPELCLTLHNASFRDIQDEGIQTVDSSYNEQETQCTVSESVEVTELNYALLNLAIHSFKI